MSANSTIVFPKQTSILRGAAGIVGITAHRALAVGQMLVSGSAVPGELQENIGNDNSWDVLFDPQSMLAAIIRTFRGSPSSPVNQVTRLDAIGISDNIGGTAATGNITFSDGPASEGGSIEVIVGSEKNHRYEVVFSKDDTVTAIGAVLTALIPVDTKSQVTALNTSGDVALTAVHKGSVGNGIGLKVIGSIPGVTINITGMSGGVGDPVLTALFDPVQSERYQTIIYPANWGFDTLTDFLDSRFNPPGQLLDGVGVSAVHDSAINLKSLANAENSASLVIAGDNKVDATFHKGPASLELPYVVMAYYAGYRALRLTEGANISNIIVGEAGLDAIGGVALSSRPYANTPFPYMPIIPTGKGFSETEIDELTEAGITVIGNNIPKNQIILGPAVTTYKTDAAGNPDNTFKFLNYVDTGSAFREFCYNNIRAAYPQTRLTDGDLIPNRPSANEDSMKAFIIQLYSLASETDLSLTRAGEVNLNIFKNGLSLSLDLGAGKVTVLMASVPIVTQLRAIDSIIQISFTAPIGG